MRQHNQELCVYSRKKPKSNGPPQQHCQKQTPEFCDLWISGTLCVICKTDSQIILQNEMYFSCLLAWLNHSQHPWGQEQSQMGLRGVEQFLWLVSKNAQVLQEHFRNTWNMEGKANCFHNTCLLLTFLWFCIFFSIFLYLRAHLQA